MKADVSLLSPNTFEPPVLKSIDSYLLDELASIIERRTMMQFNVDRRNHFVSAVNTRSRFCGDENINSYIRRVMSINGEAEMMNLIDDLAINETSFFRNVPQFNLLSKVVLPEIIKRKTNQNDPKTISIWSAACSTGQEVYTLAILVLEALSISPNWTIRIHGTDISRKVLSVARKGVYPKARLENLPPQHLSRYFDDIGDFIHVKDSLRNIVSFQQHNLNETLPFGLFDVIFCRNVMIYFSREDQLRLARKFRDRLTPEGYLFIGHSESFHGFDIGFKIRLQEGGVVYQKG
jgi:chemotaxis protein methyltransferase CheR